MAHASQRHFCNRVKYKYEQFFKDARVLDCGSLDINGSNRDLFEDCNYTGIDLGEGKNVDIVSSIHQFYAADSTYDTIISTECFEHDMHYAESLRNIVRMLRSGGLFLFTCATTGRPEHGTTRTSTDDAPLLPEGWNDYYKNLTEQDIREVLDIEDTFSEFGFEVCKYPADLYFWGIKK